MQIKTAVATLFFSLFSINTHAQSPLWQAKQQEGYTMSKMVLNLQTGKILSSQNPSLRLSPASTTKLILAASALENWGPAHFFQTEIAFQGSRQQNAIHGDLIFYGKGDPALTNERLWELASNVAKLGIQEISGDLVVNDSYFGEVKQDPNRAAANQSSHNAYNALLSSSAVNFGTIGISVAPALHVGQNAFVHLEPYSLPHTLLMGSVQTVGENQNTQINVQRITVHGIDEIHVSGKISIKDDLHHIYRSVSNPSLYAGEVFQQFLAQAGVQVLGKVRVEHAPFQPQNAHHLLTYEGEPLSQSLKGILKISNNFMADMLALSLAKEAFPQQQPSLELAGQFLEKNMLEHFLSKEDISSNLQKPPHPFQPLVLKSGSGLTPENRVSAEDFVLLLSHISHRFDIFPEFLDALPIAGVDGSLKKRFQRKGQEHLVQYVRAKTGSLTEPVNTVSLAGYTQNDKGQWIVFAFIVNGSKHSPEQMNSIRSALDDELTHIISEDCDKNTQ